MTSTEEKDQASSPAPETAVGSGTDWDEAIKQVRSTNEWIVKAFIGLGTILIGTGPILSHIRDIQFDNRGLIAGTGMFLALLGVGGIAWLASNVNLTELTSIYDLADPSTVGDRGKKRTITSLRTRIHASPESQRYYLGGKSSIEEVLTGRRKAVEALIAQETFLPAMPPTPENKTTDPRTELEREIARSRSIIAAFDKLIRYLTDWASFETIRDRFKTNRILMAFLGGIAFLGLSCWVVALNVDLSEESEEDGKGPNKEGSVAAGDIGLLVWQTGSNSSEAVASLRGGLVSGESKMDSKECDDVGVLLESGTGSADDPWQVSVLPNDPCQVRLRFTLDRRLATLAKFNPTDNKTVKVDIPNPPSHPNVLILIVATALIAGTVAIGVSRVFKFRS